MFPKLFWHIHSYGVMLLIGFYAGWVCALRRARKEGVEGKHISDMLVYTVISGIIGARALYVILEWDSFTTFWEIFEIWRGGLVFYGGLAAGTITLITVMIRRKLSIAKIADILGPAVALGLVFGRIGCFAYGCCWGDVAENFPLAVRFPGRFEEYPPSSGNIVPEGSPAFMQHVRDGLIEIPDQPGPSRSLPVIPTQLISSFDCLVIFVITSFYFRFRKRYGEVFVLFGLLYSIHRFILEILRADNPSIFFGMTISQALSLAFGLLSIIILIRLRLLPANVSEASG